MINEKPIRGTKDWNDTLVVSGCNGSKARSAASSPAIDILLSACLLVCVYDVLLRILGKRWDEHTEGSLEARSSSHTVKRKFDRGYFASCTSNSNARTIEELER